MAEQNEDALQREREMEEHERQAQERDPDERGPAGRQGDNLSSAEDAGGDPAPPGTAGRMSGGG